MMQLPTIEEIISAAKDKFFDTASGQIGFVTGAKWALEKYAEASAWVSVEEGLPGEADVNIDYPRHSIPFLVFAPTGQNVAVYHYNSREWLQKGTSIFIPNVTHYQSLPKSPTKCND